METDGKRRVAAFYMSLDPKLGQRVGVRGTVNTSVYVRVKLLKATELDDGLDEGHADIRPGEVLMNTHYIDPEPAESTETAE